MSRVELLAESLLLIFRIRTALQALMQWGVWSGLCLLQEWRPHAWEVRALPAGVPLLDTERPGNSPTAKSVFPIGPLELAIHAVTELIKSPSSISSQFYALLWSRVGKQKKPNKSKFKKQRCFKQVDLTWHFQQKSTIISTLAYSQRTHANPSIYFLSLLSNSTLLGISEIFTTKYIHRSNYITYSSSAIIQFAGWRLAERLTSFQTY